MPIIASLIKIAALALLCVDIKPMSAPPEMAGVSKAPHAQCRIYFGCTPSARLAASTATSERSSR
ncbi:MAG TPA: hypothetical protein VI232_06750 [Reyranella sp.]|jgi:hypothetical protein|nr:hypothetical protein [Rhodospirillaceae bacterium]